MQLAEQVRHPRVAALFAELHDEVTATDGAGTDRAGHDATASELSTAD